MLDVTEASEGVLYRLGWAALNTSLHFVLSNWCMVGDGVHVAAWPGISGGVQPVLHIGLMKRHI